MADFTEIALTAQRLIKDNGRRVTFLKIFPRTVSATEPWRATDTQKAPEESLQYGVFVPPSGARDFGFNEEPDRTTEQYIIVAPGPTSQVRLDEFHQVNDEMTRWNIITTTVLRPAEMVLLYGVQVRR